MQYKSIKGFTGWGQVGILLVFLGLGVILAGGLQLLIGMQLIPAGTPTVDMGEAMLKALMDPKNVAMARLSQVLGTLFLLCIPYSKNSFLEEQCKTCCKNGGKSPWLLSSLPP